MTDWPAAPSLKRLSLLKRLFWSERTRLAFFTLSLALGIGSLFAVGNLLKMIERGLYIQARDLLGADLALSAARPIQPLMQKMSREHPDLSLLLQETLPLSTEQWTQVIGFSKPIGYESIKKNHVSTSERRSGLFTETIEFASMAQPQRLERPSPALVNSDGQPLPSSEETPFLVALKGVRSDYPLRGALSTLPADAQLTATPLKTSVQKRPRYAAFLSRAGAEQRNLRLGDRLRVGAIDLELTAFLEREPSGGISGALVFAPRLLTSHAAVEASGLIQPGARIRYQQLFALALNHPTPVKLLNTLQTKLDQVLPEAIRLQTYLQAQPNTQQIFERIALFLAMVGLVALALGLLGLALGIWGLLNDQLSMIATLRCLGVSGQEIRSLYLILCIFLGLFGGLIGVVLGLALDGALSQLASPWLGFSLPLMVDLQQAGGALLVGLLLSLTLNWATLSALAEAEPHELWRAHAPSLKLSRRARWTTGLLLLLCAGIYLTWLSGSLRLSLFFIIVLVGLTLLCSLGLFVGFWCFQWMLRWSNHRAGWSLRYALGQLIGYRQRTRLGLFTIVLGLTLVGALEQLRHSFISALTIDERLVPDHFLIDVQEDQREPILQLLRERGVEKVNLNGLTRARLVSINGELIRRSKTTGNSPADRWRARALTREYNLTSRDQLNDSEEIVAGRFWGSTSPNAHPKHLSRPSAERIKVSLETRWAGRLGLKVGDRIAFDVQGRVLEGEITNLRQVNWLRLEPNFLVLLNEAALAGAPKSYISAFRIPDTRQSAELTRALFAYAPNVSIINLRAIFEEGRRLLKALAAALRVIASVCAFVGIFILLVALRLDQPRRREEAVLLDALGVTKGERLRAELLEQFLSGTLAAHLVAAGTLFMGYVGTLAMSLPFRIDGHSLLILCCLALSLAPLQVFLTARR